MRTHALTALLTLRAVPPRISPLSACTAARSLGALSDALPFWDDAALLSDNVKSSGLGLTLTGEAYADAAARWRKSLPTRLSKFAIEDVIVLPPDGRRVVSCRYRLSFDAPVPPALLPGQRRRLDAAQAAGMVIENGRTRVSALMRTTLTLDELGRCARISETLTADPFAVTTSIAHFELLNARAVALEPLNSRNGLVREPLAYWAAMRGMMRIELAESRRRSQTDEMAVLEGGDGEDVSDDDFERSFNVYMLRIFALGFMPGAAAYAAARLLRAAAESLSGG